MQVSIRRSPLAGLVAALALVAASLVPAAAQDDDKVVATVNGESVTEGDLAIAASDLDSQFQQLPAEQRRAAALSAIVEIRLMAAEAESQELDADPEFQRRMEFLRQRALHSAFIDENVTSEVDDEAVRERYDQEVSDAPATNEVRARHILVETQEEAEEIIGQLDDGADFEELARENSTDGSSEQGGDLGYFGPGQMVPAFEEVAFTLSVGDYTDEPVESQFGWHVIKVEDKRAQQPPSFDEVRDQLRSLIVREAYLERVSEIRESAEVEIEDEELQSAVDGLEQRSEQPAASEEALEEPLE